MSLRLPPPPENFPKLRRAPKKRPAGAMGDGCACPGCCAFGAGGPFSPSPSVGPGSCPSGGGTGGTGSGSGGTGGTHGGTSGTPGPGPLLDADVPIFPPLLNGL